MSAHSHQGSFEDENRVIPPPQTKGIWRVFFILCAITAVEFAFAFLMPASSFRNWIFIVLTLVKAFYIVGEFMHLKHETKSLIWTILVPTILLVWLVTALVTEGSYIGEIVSNYFN